jgi:hypothetical protein
MPQRAIRFDEAATNESSYGDGSEASEISAGVPEFERANRWPSKKMSTVLWVVWGVFHLLSFMDSFRAHRPTWESYAATLEACASRILRHVFGHEGR